MDCQSVQCKVETAIETGALPDLSADEETHIRSCAQCSTVALLVQAGLPESALESEATAPADLADSVMARITAASPGPRAVEASQASEPAPSSGIVRFLIPLAAAALLVLIVRPFMAPKAPEKTPQSVAMKKAEMAAPEESKTNIGPATTGLNGQAEGELADESAIEESEDAAGPAEGALAPVEFTREGQAVSPGGPPAIGVDRSKALSGRFVAEADKLADKVAGGEPPRPDKAETDVNALDLLKADLPKKAAKPLTADSIKDAKDQISVTASAEINVIKSVRPAPAPIEPQPEITPADDAVFQQAQELREKMVRARGMKRTARLAKPEAEKELEGDQELEKPEEESIVVEESTVVEKKSKGKSYAARTQEMLKERARTNSMIRTKVATKPGAPKTTASAHREETVAQTHFPSFIQKRFPNARRTTRDGRLTLSFLLSPTASNVLAPAAKAKEETEMKKKVATGPMFVVSVSFIPNETIAKRRSLVDADKGEPSGKKETAGKADGTLHGNAATTGPDVVTVQVATGVFYLRLTNQPAGSDTILKDLIEHLRTYR